MDIKQLEYFIAAAELLSFSRAAIKCYVVQPTISHQVLRLEEELGVRLFERNHRTMRLTKAGEVMLTEARDLVARANDIYGKMDKLKQEGQKRLRIGYYSICIDPVFGSIVYEFARENDINVKFEHLDFYQGVFFEKLLNKELDIVMTLGSAYNVFPPDERIVYVPLYNAEVRLVVSAGHALAGSGGTVDRDSLKTIGEKFLFYAPSYDENVRECGVAWHRETFDLPYAHIEVAQNTLEMQMEIEAGNAVGFMAETEIRSLNAKDRLVALRVKGAKPTEIGIAYCADEKPDYLDGFIQRVKVI